MESTQTKTKILSCMLKGPGPKYKLPSLIGHRHHDPTRKVEPAYSIRNQPKKTIQNDVPGPNKYPPLYNKTNRGVQSSPAYTVGLKRPDKVLEVSPSPADYRVEYSKNIKYKTPPAYTIRQKLKETSERPGPGPNIMLPTCIGPKIPDKKCEAAYTIPSSRPKDRLESSPGPANYYIRLDAVRRKSPAYSMKFKIRDEIRNDIPGPKYFAENVKRRAPTFAFGIKHSQCTVLPMTPEDNY